MSNEAPEFDAEEVSAKRKETEKQRAKRLTADVAAVLASESGRNVLRAVLGFCQIESINAQDGMAAGRIEGARAVGIQTYDLLRRNDPAGFMNLYREIHQ